MSEWTHKDGVDGIKKQAQELIDQAYQRGYKAAKDDCAEAVAQLRENYLSDGIAQGRNEAWEAARKLSDSKNVNEILDDTIFYCVNIFERHTASEAISKIKAYEEQKKQEEDKIKVGDEVRWLRNRDVIGIVTHIDYPNKMTWIMGHDGRHFSGCSHEPEKWEKTGRHFPEIAEALKKLGGKQDADAAD